MPENIPTFSIIVPTYNRALSLENLLNSLLNINYPRNYYEIIVVNDGSTDNTQDVLNRFNKKIKFFNIENSERGYARNFGAMKSKFTYINFFDSDDICLSNHLICAAASIISNNFPECIAQGYKICLEDGTTTYETKWADIKELNKSLYMNTLSCNGVFLKREITENFKFIEERLFAGSEDWFLWFRIAHNFPIIVSPHITHKIIEHQGRSVYNSNIFKSQKKIKALINLVKKFNDLNNKIDLRSRAISYLELELAQIYTSDKNIKNKFKGIFSAIKSFLRNPEPPFFKIFILTFTNFLTITRSRKF